ncbi:hypothetical protein EDD29_8317 [Actinocorallia herbida]|uniref:Uncharacterized protein n=1 Tax=Actinocorallia herbida TaxID=58109 RepID=A0A3N1DAT9_9ACTN|nr:hypothetical protein [Actinocorallia herbida]ROO90586.1 hypothetical protein EDD29_8317 [Actinocorallia herbida]
MQSATKAPSTGDRLEARVAQVWFWEGFYARRGVNFQRYYQEPLQVTDLDLFAFDFNPQLAIRRYIGEVKSGTGRSAPKALDRIIWLSGLKSLTGADAGELTIAASISAKAQSLSRGLGISAQSVEDVERRESDAVGPLADLGSQGVNAFILEQTVRLIAKKNIDLERAFNFLRGEVYFLDPFLAAKQLIDLLRRITLRWTPRLQDGEEIALRWLAAEALSLLTLNLVTVASAAMALDRKSWNAYVMERLAEGAVPMRHMRALSDSVDKFVAGVLSAAGASPEMKTAAIGAFLPEPPDYAEPFAELCWRLKSDAPAARALPRQLDFVVYERLVHQRQIHEIAAARLGVNRDSSMRLIRLVVGFVRGCEASFVDLERALTETS